MDYSNSICPKCYFLIGGPFPPQCPNCDFDLTGLAGRGTSTFQAKKWQKHSDIYFGRGIQLQPGEIYNASFDYNGVANLDDIVRFTITFGEKMFLPNLGNRIQTSGIISYIPEIIGSGTAIHFPGMVPCSGICLVSPASKDYSHSFPIIDEWVQRYFSGVTSVCKRCGTSTDFGQPICSKCYQETGFDWRQYI